MMVRDVPRCSAMACQVVWRGVATTVYFRGWKQREANEIGLGFSVETQVGPGSTRRSIRGYFHRMVASFLFPGAPSCLKV